MVENNVCAHHGKYTPNSLSGVCPQCAAENHQKGSTSVTPFLDPRFMHISPELEAAINRLSDVIEKALKEMGYKKEC